MNENKPNNEFSSKLIKLYVIALSAVVIFLLISQSLVQWAISEQQNDSRVVNIAGRQRMLSQKLCKTSILLVKNFNSDEKKRYLADLKDIISIWEKCHYGLKNGKLSLESDYTVKNSEKINIMFQQLQPVFETILNSACDIDHEINSNKPNLQLMNNALAKILSNENNFLKTMDKIVFQYDAEAKSRIEQLKFIEFSLFIITMIILVLEALFIYIPTYKQINNTINALKQSEKNLQNLNNQLQIANESIIKAEKELLKATEEKYKIQIKEDKIRSASLIEGQEEERKRLALELHDGIGQMLTGLKLLSEKFDVTAFKNEKDQKTFDDLKQLINSTIAETRVISFNLMPAVLNDFGIVSAIKLLVEQFERSSGIKVHYVTNHSKKKIPQNIEFTLYRIAQEALNNALKHGHATEITIILDITSQRAHLEISDNGKGFDTRVLRWNKFKSGIKNMKSRTEINNGTIKIRSKINKGTIISVDIPFF